MRKDALANGIAKGRFDLSGVEARSRLHRAREYVDATCASARDIRQHDARMPTIIADKPRRHIAMTIPVIHRPSDGSAIAVSATLRVR
jgi:hypothetical protein